MANVRQKKLAKNIIESLDINPPPTRAQLAVSSGYSVSMAEKNPKVLFDSKGVKEALEEFGFSEDIAKKVVGEILIDEDVKARDRLSAADMIFKVNASYAPVKAVNVNIDIPQDSDDIRLKYEAELQAKLLGQHAREHLTDRLDSKEQD